MPFDLPALGVALLVLYPLAQIPVVLYLARYVALRDGESALHSAEGYALYGDVGGEAAAGQPDASTDRAVGVGVACRRCGAANAVEFRYCHRCVARLE